METGLLLSLGSAPLSHDPEKEISRTTFSIRPAASGCLLKNTLVQALIAKYLFSTPLKHALSTFFFFNLYHLLR